LVSFTLWQLYLRERAPDTHCIGGWVGRRAILDAVVKRKISSLRRESNPRTPMMMMMIIFFFFFFFFFFFLA
jgi:membrane protein insertase Oxa1/YidC/SpoIIIJ